MILRLQSKSKSKSKGSATTVSKKVLEREAALNASSALDDDSDDDLLYLAAANPQTRKVRFATASCSSKALS